MFFKKKYNVYVVLRSKVKKFFFLFCAHALNVNRSIVCTYTCTVELHYPLHSYDIAKAMNTLLFIKSYTNRTIEIYMNTIRHDLQVKNGYTS